MSYKTVYDNQTPKPLVYKDLGADECFIIKLEQTRTYVPFYMKSQAGAIYCHYADGSCTKLEKGGIDENVEVIRVNVEVKVTLRG